MPRTVSGRWLTFLLMALIVGSLGGCSEAAPPDTQRAVGAAFSAQATAVSPVQVPGGQEQCAEVVMVHVSHDSSRSHTPVCEARVFVSARPEGAAGCRGPDTDLCREVDLHRLQVLRT